MNSSDVLTIEPVRTNLLAFLEQRTETVIEPDLDLFASGLVSSLFALQLVVHIEQSFGVAIGGSDLQLDNFRTVNAMAALVLRLRGETGEADEADEIEGGTSGG